MLKQATVGFVLGLVLIRGLAACGSPAAIQCRVEAVRFLPLDEDQLTGADVKDLVGRLKACRVQGDAGR